MKLKILLVSNQVRGIDGTGGLGDVATALAKAFALHEDIDIRVLMPGYQTVSGKEINDRFHTVITKDISVPFGDKIRSAHICQYMLPKSHSDEPSVPCYLLCIEEFDQAKDLPEQAILLCRGTIEFLRVFENFRPDIIHCNDWHTGLIPVYLNTLYGKDPYLGRIATLYTTHNVGYFYQGAFPDKAYPTPAERLLYLAGLGSWAFQPLQTRSLEHQVKFNFTKGGLGFADLINTVSITYSHEIRTQAFGGGFEHLLQERSRDLCGIVNGIDTAEWNPADDPNISPYNYSKSDAINVILKQKRHIRQLLKSWGRDNRKPFSGLKNDTHLLSLIGRLSDQKVAILMPVLEKICGLGNIQIIVLGASHPLDSHGKQYAAQIHRLADMPGNQMFFFEGFEPELSHLIYAASDMLLMPSTYEPCGLAQLISMRYGTVPVVRFTGGLVDTVVDEQAGPNGSGFGFKEPVSNGFAMANIPHAAELLLVTIGRAIEICNKYPKRWEKLVKNGMVKDSSWAIPANQYMKIYHEAIDRRVRFNFLSA